MLKFLMESDPGSYSAYWWRLSSGTPTAGGHPAAAWVGQLLGAAAEEPGRCPRCHWEGTLCSVLEHFFTHHGPHYAEAADWLESLEPDLHTLAVHYLAGKERAAHCRQP